MEKQLVAILPIKNSCWSGLTVLRRPGALTSIQTEIPLGELPTMSGNPGRVFPLVYLWDSSEKTALASTTSIENPCDSKCFLRTRTNSPSGFLFGFLFGFGNCLVDHLFMAASTRFLYSDIEKKYNRPTSLSILFSSRTWILILT